ncbi:MAG: peptidoglycan recognition family protein [Patescibacteria group bacterium]
MDQKENTNPEEPFDSAQGKREFLKREEVRSMEKDLAKARGQAAEQERERITRIPSPERLVPPTPTPPPPPPPPPPSPLPQQTQPSGPMARLELPASSSSAQKVKVLVRIVVAAISMLLIGNASLFAWWYLTQKEAPQEQQPAEEQEQQPGLEEEQAPPLLLEIEERLVSWGHVAPPSPRTIDTIVLLSSYDAFGQDPYSVEGVLGAYQQYNVTPHYLIGRDGKVFRLVLDKNNASHAGWARLPDGRTDVNAVALGIALVYARDESPTEEQYQKLTALVAKLKEQYGIQNESIFKHKDIATAAGRIDSPWNFDKERLLSLLSPEL